MLEHRCIVQLLTCVKKGVTTGFLSLTSIENAVLRNQGLKNKFAHPKKRSR